MILVVSDEIDQTTNHVIDWITYFGFDFIRINPADHCVVNEILINEKISFEVDIVKKEETFRLKFDDITSVWYRRGNLKNLIIDQFEFDFSNSFHKDVYEYLLDEWDAVREFIFYALLQKRSIGNYFKKVPNKLIVLHEALKAGLSIPHSIITSNYNNLHSISLEMGLITKPIQDIFNCIYQNKQYCSYTSEVEVKTIDSLGAHFFPSLLQEKILAKHEIRIFFLHSELHAMAIIAKRKQKIIDYRQAYDNFQMLPFKLPIEVESGLLKLIASTGLDTGSIDMLVDEQDKYYFLEVNPLGQFGMVSYPCNYYLERKVAKYLCYG